MIGIILGTRPELIKLFPLIEKLKKKKINFKIIHTGQHYSKNLNESIIKNLNNIKIDYYLNSRSHPHTEQVCLMMQKIDRIINKNNFKIIFVYGDTNSALAGALSVAKNKKIKLVHLEAGLRSFEKKMPEEINRTIIDHISDYLFTPTKLATRFCLNENISKNKIIYTGNLISDSIRIIKKRIGDFKTIDKYNFTKNNYILVTFHREENLNDYNRLISIVKLLNTLSNYLKIPVILSCHPHTKKILKENKIKFMKNICIVDPFNYENFLNLLYFSKLIVSDSGGIQEECCILKKKMLTIRSSTERQETLNVGGNLLIDINKYKVSTIKKHLDKKIIWRNPYGNFNVSNKVIREIYKIKKIIND